MRASYCKGAFNNAFMKTILILLVGLLYFCQTPVFAADQPEYLQSFDPAKGFKPAQRNLTEIYLQFAGSLEYYGSPEPYLNHVRREHQRIEAAYLRKFGKLPKSRWPAYMTDDYTARSMANWNVLSPKLGLQPLTQDIGHNLRLAIKGTRDTGTMLVEILNEHQKHVFEAMRHQKVESASFDVLKSNLVARLELGKKEVNEERYEIPRRDAVSFSLAIEGITLKLFKKLDASLKPADAERIKAALISQFIDMGRIAQSELEAGIAEWALNTSATASK